MTPPAVGGNARDRPLFVVGCPRSGTTLLLSMLNRHSRVAICGETYFHYYVLSRTDAFGDSRMPEVRARIADAYLATFRGRGLGADPAALRARLVDRAADAPSMFLELMRDHAESRGKDVIGDKTPHHALVARDLAALYPGCRILHLVRDPRDVVASLQRMPWGQGSAVANARLWRDCVRGAEAAGGHPGFLRVHYERLVEAPEAELRTICAALELAWDPAMLGEGGSPTPDRWWFQRAKGAVETSRRRVWEDALTDDEARGVEWVAGDWMRELGYRAELPAATTALKARSLVRSAFGGAARRVRDLPRAWIRRFRPTDLAAEEARLDAASNAASQAAPNAAPNERPR